MFASVCHQPQKLSHTNYVFMQFHTIRRPSTKHLPVVESGPTLNARDAKRRRGPKRGKVSKKDWREEAVDSDDDDDSDFDDETGSNKAKARTKKAKKRRKKSTPSQSASVPMCEFIIFIAP